MQFLSSHKFLLIPALILVLPFVLFELARHRSRDTSSTDPTSIYFDPNRAYRHRYTAIRHDETDTFLDSVENRKFQRNTTAPPLLCVGMLSIKRPEGVYFRSALGSLVAGLRQEERDQIYLMPMIGHWEPETHPAYSESWLHNIADEVLLYDKNSTWHQHLHELELEREKTGLPDREKHMNDYTYLMEECSKRRAPYVLMMEDDVMALDGWFHRTKAGLQQVEKQTKLQGALNFFYLRLFYTERDWSLNETDFHRLRVQSFYYMMPVTAIVALFAYATVTRTRYRPLYKLIFVAAIIISLLTSGRLIYKHRRYSGRFTSLPFETIPTGFPNGVLEMPIGGCCAQALVYPTTVIPLLADYYRMKRIGFVDTWAEELSANEPEKTGKKWSLGKAVVQHIGGKSSKGDNWGSDKPGELSEAERIWSFSFESNDELELKDEHRMAVEMEKQPSGVDS